MLAAEGEGSSSRDLTPDFPARHSELGWKLALGESDGSDHSSHRAGKPAHFQKARSSSGHMSVSSRPPTLHSFAPLLPSETLRKRMDLSFLKEWKSS